MNYDEAMNIGKVEFGQMPPQAFLLGLLSAFDNRYQAVADNYFKEITWKQFFAIICINLCKEPPTLNDLSDVMGSSHQNVKQILIKLEKKGFVTMVPDEKDKRKQRIFITDKCREFSQKSDRQNPNSQAIISKIYEGIDEKNLMTTIETIMHMERNLSKL
ncbi:MAG: MarR family transcriptional regulator [Butyrivibrio sp.]|nr:MarR family transcriptional regulator [Butyrivibrio sp.]